MPPNKTTVRPTSFFLLTFVLSWLIWIPLVLSHFHLWPIPIPEGVSNGVRLLGVLMPATAAMILSSQVGGRKAIGALFSRLWRWRVNWKWWLAAALGQPFLLAFTYLIYNRLWGDPPLAPLTPGPIAGFLVNAVFLLIATLGEEIGWRGVALPELQTRHNALTSSIILGVLWATWHVPFWLLMDTFDQFGAGYLALNCLLLPMTFYITWFFNHSRSSLLLPVVFHLTFNLVNTALLPVTLNTGAFTILIVLEWIVGLAVIPWLKPGKKATTD